MELIAHSEVFARFPGMRLAMAVAHGVDNAREQPQIEALWQEAWTGAVSAAEYGNAQSQPRVRPWRERFAAMGVSGKEFPSSVEALLRRAMKGGEPFRISPLVDFYNAVSLRHLVPAGAFDLAQLSGPLELRLTRAGDRFLALDAEEAVEVPPGEVAYADSANILTRHFVWRQARTGLVSADTRDVFLVSEIPGEVGAQVADEVLEEFHSGFRSYFGADPVVAIVDEQHPSTRW